MDITKYGFGTVERMLESMGNIVVYNTVRKQYIDDENRIASRDVTLVRLKPEELEKAVEKDNEAKLRLRRSWPILWKNLSPGITEEDISYLFRYLTWCAYNRHQKCPSLFFEFLLCKWQY